MKYYKSVKSMCQDIISYLERGGIIECDNSIDAMVFGFKCINSSESWYIKYQDFMVDLENEKDMGFRLLLLRVLSDLTAQNALVAALKNLAQKTQQRHLRLVSN